MHEVHTFAFIIQRPLDRGAYEALCAFHGNRLDANARRVGEAHLGIFLREGFLEDFHEFFVVCRAIRKFNTRINIFGILTEDDHIHKFGMSHGRRHTFIPTHGTLANIQVQ